MNNILRFFCFLLLTRQLIAAPEDFESIAADFARDIYKESELASLDDVAKRWERIEDNLNKPTVIPSNPGLRTADGRNLRFRDTLFLTRDDIYQSSTKPFPSNYLDRLAQGWAFQKNVATDVLTFSHFEEGHLLSAEGQSSAEFGQVENFQSFWNKWKDGVELDIPNMPINFDQVPFEDVRQWIQENRDLIDLSDLSKKIDTLNFSDDEKNSLKEEASQKFPTLMPAKITLEESGNLIVGLHPIAAKKNSNDLPKYIRSIMNNIILKPYTREMSKASSRNERMEILMKTMLRIHYLHVMPDGNGRVFFLMFRSESIKWGLPLFPFKNFDIINIPMGTQKRISLATKEINRFLSCLR